METEEKKVHFEDDEKLDLSSIMANLESRLEEEDVPGIELDNLVMQDKLPAPQNVCQRIWRRIQEVGVRNLLILLAVLMGMAWFSISSYLVLLDAERLDSVYNYSENAATITSWMDLSADACEDFVQFSSGTALDNIILRDDQKYVNLAFGEATETLNSRVTTIIDEQWPYISSFYKSCMDEAVIDARGVAPISGTLLRFSAAQNVSRLLNTAAGLRLESGLDLELFFSTQITRNVFDPELNVISLQCRGGNLPDSTYYAVASVTTAYTTWLKTVFSAVGLPLDDTDAFRLLQLERHLDCNTGDAFNLRAQSQLNRSLGADVTGFLRTLGVLNNSEIKVNLDSPAYYTQLQVVLNTTDQRTLLNYAFVSIFLRTFTLLGRPFQDLMLQYEQIVTGVGALPARTNFCIRSTERSLGMLLSHYYIKSYFSVEARNRTAIMIEQLRNAYENALQQDDWMDEMTRAEALRKFTQLDTAIGYPDNWPDLDTLLQRSQSRRLSGHYYEDVLMLRRARDWSSLQHLGNTPMKDRWDMLPIETNAYYSAEENRIVIPAGFIIEPLFDETAPDAVNYCRLGAVIGHELGHAIDSSGAEFNADGRLVDWWTPASREQFEQRVQCIVEQYSAFEISPEEPLDGELVSGEAMADLNGLSQALAALIAHRKLDPEATSISDKEIEDKYGLTWKQLCFVSYAQMWAEKARLVYELQLSREDPHPMPRFRVEGTLQNMPAFAAVFDCPVGSRYNPEKKCELNKR